MKSNLKFMLDLMPFKIDVFSRHFARNASYLMDSNLFQLKCSTFWETYRWVLVTWGFLRTHFQSSVGLFIWKYQIGSCMWVIGHLASNEQHGQLRHNDAVLEYSKYNGNS